MLDHQLLIVYSESDDTFYQELARRLFTACTEDLRESALCSSRELFSVAPDELGGAALMVVDPVACAATASQRSQFFSKLALARKRIAVLAEAVESTRYRQQSRLPVNFDAIFDVGFVSQRDKHPLPDVPYHFVFNGPTKEEEQVVAELVPSRERCIPWTVVGHQTPNNLNLVAELMDYKLYQGGFCLLQHRRHRGRKGERLLSSSALAAVLSRTNYYVWPSDDPFAYYESFRFVQALLAGAVPCKIAGDQVCERSDIPGTFPSVRSFWARAQDEGHWPMYCAAREFYMSGGTLAKHLEKALHLVR